LAGFEEIGDQREVLEVDLLRDASILHLKPEMETKQCLVTIEYSVKTRKE
jgi:hypothetical protein